jgi:hypothetical protein
MSNIKVFKRLGIDVNPDYDNPVTNMCKYLNQFDIFKSNVLKTNVNYNLFPLTVTSGAMSDFNKRIVNQVNLNDAVKSLVTSKPTYYLKLVEFVYTSLTNPIQGTKLYAIQDDEYVDLKMKLFPFIDIKVKGNNTVVENLSYDYMDVSNYQDGNDAGNYFVYYKVNDDGILRLKKIVKVDNNKRYTFKPSNKEWEEMKINTITKSAANHWLYNHTFLHKVNAEIYNEFVLNPTLNKDLLMLLNAFSEEMLFVETLVVNAFFGMVTNEFLGEKDDTLYHLNFETLAEINIFHGENDKVSKLVKGYHSYTILKMYRKTIIQFVNQYVSKCKLSKADNEVIETICANLKQSAIKLQNVNTINDVLTIYITNVVLHSINHVQTSSILYLFGHMGLHNRQATKFIPLYHDEFGYNLSFWLGERFKDEITVFKSEFKKIHSYCKKCELDKILGNNVLASAINL